MFKAKSPPRIPCAGERFCVPMENCPIGSTVTVIVTENPQNLVPPQVVGVFDDYIEMIGPQSGTFKILVSCCPS